MGKRDVAAKQNAQMRENDFRRQMAELHANRPEPIRNDTHPAHAFFNAQGASSYHAAMTDKNVRAEVESACGGAARAIMNRLQVVCQPAAASLYDALCQHGVGNLDEAGHICAIDVADAAVSAAAMTQAGVVDIAHDGMQAGIDFVA